MNRASTRCTRGIARARAERGGLPDAEASPWFEGPLLVDPRTHPHVAAVSRQLAGLEDRELFMLGVDAVIRSAEQLSR